MSDSWCRDIFIKKKPRTGAHRVAKGVNGSLSPHFIGRGAAHRHGTRATPVETPYTGGIEWCIDVYQRV